MDFKTLKDWKIALCDAKNLVTKIEANKPPVQEAIEFMNRYGGANWKKAVNSIGPGMNRAPRNGSSYDTDIIDQWPVFVEMVANLPYPTGQYLFSEYRHRYEYMKDISAWKSPKILYDDVTAYKAKNTKE